MLVLGQGGDLRQEGGREEGKTSSYREHETRQVRGGVIQSPRIKMAFNAGLPRRTMAGAVNRRKAGDGSVAVDKQLVILAALVIVTILFIGVGMYYSTHVVTADEDAKEKLFNDYDEAFQSKLHPFKSAVNNMTEEIELWDRLNPRERRHHMKGIMSNFQAASKHLKGLMEMNGELDAEGELVKYDDDGKSELLDTYMRWGNWALCASWVQFNRRDTFEYMQELARDFHGKVVVAKDRNSFTVDWSRSIGSRPCHDPRYVSQDLLTEVNMVYSAQCSCSNHGLAGQFLRNQTWTRMSNHGVTVFKEGYTHSEYKNKKYQDIFKDCGVRVPTEKIRQAELSIQEDVEAWNLDMRHMKYVLHPMKMEHFDEGLNMDHAVHLRRSRCAKKSTYTLDPKRLKTKGLTDDEKRRGVIVEFHEDDRLMMELPSKVFDDEEDDDKVRDVFFHYVFQKDYYFFNNAGYLTFANIAIKHMIRMIEDHNIDRDVPVLELGAADGWFGTAVMSVVPQAELTFTDIKMKYMNDLKWGWKRNKFDEKRAVFLEGSLFDPLENLKAPNGKLKKYDFIYFNPPQDLGIRMLSGADTGTKDGSGFYDETPEELRKLKKKKGNARHGVKYEWAQQLWQAPQFDFEPIDDVLVDNKDSLDWFRKFERLYERYLNPGGVAFFVVEVENVPAMYKLFLTSPRAKHRTVRRWWVPNCPDAFLAVSDERPYENSNRNDK